MKKNFKKETGKLVEGNYVCKKTSPVFAATDNSVLSHKELTDARDHSDQKDFSISVSYL